MKKFSVLLLLLIAAVCSRVPYRPFAVRVAGVVYQSTNGKDFTRIIGPSILPSEVILRTGELGEIEVQTAEHFYFVLTESSEVQLKAGTLPDSAQDFQAHLETGRIQFKVRGIDTDRRFSAHTATTVAGVRGTGFEMRYVTHEEGPPETIITVVEGEVIMTDNATNTQTSIPELQQARAAPGRAVTLTAIPPEDLHCLKDIEDIEFLDYSEIRERLGERQ